MIKFIFDFWELNWSNFDIVYFFFKIDAIELNIDALYDKNLSINLGENLLLLWIAAFFIFQKFLTLIMLKCVSEVSKADAEYFRTREENNTSCRSWWQFFLLLHRHHTLFFDMLRIKNFQCLVSVIWYAWFVKYVSVNDV